MRRLIDGSLVVAATLLLVFAASCSQATTPTPAPTAKETPRPAAAATAPTVATAKVTIGFNWKQPTIDPHITNSQANFASFYPLYESLYNRGSSGNPEPRLATGLTVSSDGLTYDFALRQGVKFHNGDSFTSEDVKFSLERSMDPKLKYVYGQALTDYIASVEAPSPSQVIIKLKKAWPAFLIQLDSYLWVIPKNYTEQVGSAEFNGKPVGTGPFKFVKKVQDDYTEFEAFEGYWGTKARVKSLILKEIPDDASRLAMLKTGQIDIAANVPAFSAADVEKTAGLALKTDFGFGEAVVSLSNLDKAHPFANKKVREALNYAVDKDAVVKTIMAGRAMPANFFVPPASTGSDPKSAAYPYDVGKAKKLLADAGYPNGFDAGKMYWYTGMENGAELTQAVASYFGGVGVKIEPTLLEINAYRERRTGHNLVPGSFVVAYGDTPHSLGYWRNFLRTGATFSSYSDPELDALFDKTEAAKTMDEQVPVLRELYRKIYEDPAWVPLYFIPSIWGINKEKIAEWPLPLGSSRGGYYNLIVPAGK